MAFPFRSLRFSGEKSQSWGIALSRQMPRKSEYTWWPYITNRVDGFARQFGTLEGLEDISPGRNLQFIPYTSGAWSRFLAPPGFADFTTNGFYITAAYFLIPKKLQVAVQWQDLNPGQMGNDGIHSITGGLNYYIHGDDLKLMVDYIHTWSDFREANPEFGNDQFDEVIGRVQLTLPEQPGERKHPVISMSAGPPDRTAPGRNLTPVMARLDPRDVEVLDALITAGIVPNRAEGVRWALTRIRERPAYTQLREHIGKIDDLKAQL